MKNAKNIISHLINSPLYHQIQDLNTYKSLLPSKFQNLIFFTYLKNEPQENKAILMIALYHPLGLCELKKDSNIKELKEILKIYVKFNPSSNLAKVNDIKFFVANKTLQKQELAKKTLQENEQDNIEIAKGNFTNNFKDEKLNKIFEDLRRKIIANRTN